MDMKDTKTVTIPRPFLRGRIEELQRLEADVLNVALSRCVSGDVCSKLIFDGIAAHLHRISEALTGAAKDPDGGDEQETA
jgi:hypothetical protein